MMVQTRARKRKLAVALTLIACATAVVSIAGSGAISEQGTGNTQRVSAQPLPEVSASPPELLAALVQQSPPNSGSTRSVERVVFDRAPVRIIKDAYPGFSGVWVDPIRNEIVVNDESRYQVLVYDRTANTPPAASFTEPKRVIAGPDAIGDFNCGLWVDPQTGDIYTLANDTGATLSVFKYGSQGNVPPDRTLYDVKGYSIAIDEERQEMFLTEHNLVNVFRKEAEGDEEPLRTLTGPRTRLGSVTGIAIDTRRNVMFVVSHGNYGASRTEDGVARYEPSLITVYPLDAEGNVAPIRVIQGPHTQMNHPGLAFADEERGELYVANPGDDSFLVFAAEADGDVAPLRVIKGSRTGLKAPRAVVVDFENDELVVSNLGNHSIVVFPRDANGNVAPLRTIRAAPEGKQALMVANPGAVAYDSRRDQILAPN